VGLPVTDYALTGKKGTGKSKHAVILARDRYLRNGRRVTTNLDIDLLKMFGPRSRMTYVRVPDKPCAFDLVAAGSGNLSYDEDENGGMFLDELGTWLNTRSFADKERAAVLDYFAHARKYGWDTWYIMQNIVQVDKQLRESFIEQTVRHTRFDKVRIPFIGWLLSMLFTEKAGYFPKFHTAVFRIGVNPQDLVANRSSFIGRDIQDCYDTRQVFLTSYPHGTHSVLSPWHVEGRYLEPPKPSLWASLCDWFHRAISPAPARPVRRPVTRPDPAMARVLALAASLAPDERLRVIARYSRASMLAAQRGASAPLRTARSAA
jgi:hypothetical protein